MFRLRVIYSDGVAVGIKVAASGAPHPFNGSRWLCFIRTPFRDALGSSKSEFGDNGLSG